LIRFFF